MKNDVLTMLDGRIPSKRPSKDTLNHPGLVKLASGIDPFENTRDAYLKAYGSLGIDLVNRVPEENAPEPMKRGQTRKSENGCTRSYLGIYDTVAKSRYAFDSVEDFWASGKIELDYNRLMSPLHHPLDKDILNRKAALLGDLGVYIYSVYTTLFMWGVEYLGWEVFMLAASEDPEGFNEKFFDTVFAESLRLIGILAEADSPFVFCHDDLADARGPVFSPAWYDKYIFPRYSELWQPAKKAGKKVIFIADGNMGPLLGALKETGVDGVMLENPATDFDLILDYFKDSIIIGGVETNILTFGSAPDIRRHVSEVAQKTKDIPGFVMSSPGGLHGNIPIENLEAYFDTRVMTGHTNEGWRKA